MIRLLTIIFFYSISHAAEPSYQLTIPKMETSRVLYSSSLGSNLSYYVDVLGRGYPIGRLETKKEAPKQEAHTFEEMIAILRAYNQEWYNSFTESQKNFGKEIDRLNVVRTGIVPNNDEQRISPSKLVAVMPLTKESLDAFFICASKALPLLKKSLQSIELKSNEGYEQAIDEKLSPEKGDGKLISKIGISCGKYLGPLGYKAETKIEEVKTLSALLNAKLEPNMGGILPVFFLYGQSYRDAKVNLPDFWNYAWKRMSFEIVFKASNRADLDTIQKEYLDELLKQKEDSFKRNKIELPISEIEIKNKISLDVQHAEKVLESLK